MDSANEDLNNDIEIEAESNELDDNDKKIISLYEVINELIEECKYRTRDLIFLHESNENVEPIDTVAVIEQIEERNDISLQQIFEELELKEKANDTDNENENENDSEDETDQNWDIYNTVVKNLNEYMEAYADSIQKIRDLRKQVTSLESFVFCLFVFVLGLYLII